MNGHHANAVKLHSCVFIALEISVSLIPEVCELLKEEYSRGPIDVWDVKVMT